MNKISVATAVSRVLLGAGLLVGACAAQASVIDPASDQVVSGRALVMADKASAPSSYGAEAVPSSGAPSNPYLAFADLLAMSPETSGQGSAPSVFTSSKVASVAFFDATNGIPAPGPVPIPGSLLLLVSGLAVLGARMANKADQGA